MGLWSDKCKRCGIKYGNNAVKGANTPAGLEGLCGPCWRELVDREGSVKAAKKAAKRKDY